MVAAERHQRLRADDPADHQGRGERRGQRPQQLRLGGREGSDGGPGAVALADPAVADSGAERVEGSLGLGHREVVRDGPPPALRGGVVGLLHAALAVPVSRGTQLDRNAVVLGDSGEARGDPASVRADDGGHPVEAPLLRDTPEPPRDRVESVD